MQSFRKEERLCNLKLISTLFKEGNNFFIYPIKVTWIYAELSSEYPVQVLIAVNKRNFPRAVDRNKLKRLMREAYRKNKSVLYDHLEHTGKKCALAFIYSGNKAVSFKEIESIIIVILHRLIREYEGATW
jgi:ribonuclease P protein component